MHAIERTPPLASASRMMPVASTEVETTTEAETATEATTAAEAATAIEAANLMSTMSGIDKLISDMVAEEAVATAEEIVAVVPGKVKEVADTSSKGKEFDLRHLGGQELSEAEKEELEENAKSCGYLLGYMLFGGVDEEILGCIHDRAGAKIFDTISKSASFPKLESDISGYRWQHIVGNLFYSNFKVKFICLDCCYLCDELKFSEVSSFSQSMLMSKALRMQQNLEDKKNEIIIEGLESKTKDCEASLEKKDFLLQATEGSLVELQAENGRLNKELLQAQTTLKEKLECFEQEKKELQAKYRAEADKTRSYRNL
jgi:hypothetical protein